MILNRIDDAHGKKIIFLDFISDDKVITIGGDSTITIWDRDTCKPLISNKMRYYRIHAAELSFDKQYLFIGVYEPWIVKRGEDFDLTERFKLVIFKITNGEDIKFVKEIDGTTEIISYLSISADNKYAAVLKDDSTIDIWGLENGYISHSYSEPEYKDIKFDPLGGTVLVSLKSGKIQRWNTRGIIPESASARAQYIGERYLIKSPKEPLITREKHSGITLAVLNFTANSITEDIARTISYFFRVRVSSFPFITLIEKEDLNKVLDIKVIESILKGKGSRKLADELKKIKGIQKLIMGDISKLNSTLILSIKVVDTESAIIEGRILECQNYVLENVPEMIEILIGITIEK